LDRQVWLDPTAVVAKSVRFTGGVMVIVATGVLYRR
jgi:hypothetical protein